MIKQVHFYANKSCYYICKPLILSAFSYAYFPLFHRLCTGSGYNKKVDSLLIINLLSLYTLSIPCFHEKVYAKAGKNTKS